LANKLWRDLQGSVLVEAAIMLPLFFLVSLSLVDLSYLMFDWARANKAVYAGAHRAIVSDAVAGGITSPTWDVTLIGLSCSDSTGTNVNCPSEQSVCTPTADGAGSCTGGFAFDEAAFQDIFTRMQAIYQCSDTSTCPLQRQNVSISYATNGLGFVGQPNGLPMQITVSITCMVHTFYFIGALMQWSYGSAAPGCTGTPTGWYIPAYSTLLTSEDMATN
jgi:hypothetical protein